jgi:hypothetical protein
LALCFFKLTEKFAVAEFREEFIRQKRTCVAFRREGAKENLSLKNYSYLPVAFITKQYLA